MKTNFRSKLHDIINTSFSENTLNKSQKNILLDTDPYLNKRIKTSSSTPKYKNILNSNNFKISSNKENIQDMLNRSFTELGIKRKTKVDSSSKKSIFDDVHNDTIDFIGENTLKKNYDYDSIIHNIKINNRKKTKNFLLGMNNNNEFNSKYYNNNNKIITNKNSFSNNYQLKKKIFNFANELKNEYNYNSLSFVNKPVSTIQNDFSYSSPFNNGRINNLTKGNNISKIYDNDNSLQLNNRSVNKNKTIDVGFNNSRNHNKYFSNYNLKKEKKEDLIEYMKGFNLERKNLINNKNQVIKNYHGINLDF
jgi:hypothetical protein